jgi:hypothetical protein
LRHLPSFHQKAGGTGNHWTFLVYLVYSVKTL